MELENKIKKDENDVGRPSVGVELSLGKNSMNIKRNIGGIDRVLRIGIGISMIYFGFISDYIITDAVAGSIFGMFGSVMLVIAVVGNCPFYSVIGFTTRHDSEQTYR